MDVMMYIKTLVLVLKEGDDIGYVKGVNPDVTNLVSEHDFELSLSQRHFQPRLCNFVFIFVKCDTLMDMNLNDT